MKICSKIFVIMHKITIFLAMDREKGAEWLRGLLQKFGPIIKASCHQIVNYKGREFHNFS